VRQQTPWWQWGYNESSSADGSLGFGRQLFGIRLQGVRKLVDGRKGRRDVAFTDFSRGSG
jgi:hypothetical protein